MAVLFRARKSRHLDVQDVIRMEVVGEFLQIVEASAMIVEPAGPHRD